MRKSHAEARPWPRGHCPDSSTRVGAGHPANGHVTGIRHPFTRRLEELSACVDRADTQEKPAAKLRGARTGSLAGIVQSAQLRRTRKAVLTCRAAAAPAQRDYFPKPYLMPTEKDRRLMPPTDMAADRIPGAGSSRPASCKSAKKLYASFTPSRKGAPKS